MLGLDNPIHIAFLLILLLLVFGAKRLPEMGKSLGAGMRGFKDTLTGESTQPALTTQQSASAAPTPPPPLASAPAPGPATAQAPGPTTAPAPVMPPAEKPRAPSAA
jgi:sec-independent protein translocase protein TatA